MIGLRRIIGAMAGAITPAVAVASDFHWPEFHFDQSPVEPLWHGVGEGFESGMASVGTLLVIGALIVGVLGYAKALAEVKAGRLVVYRDWKDFLMSSAWIILIPLGYSWMADDSAMRILGFASIGYGLYCLWQMITGAFKLNSGNARWLSLFARFAVTLLLIFALAKLNEQFENYKQGKYGYKYRYFSFMRGVVLPLAIFAWVFHVLIQPMVGVGVSRTRRGTESW